MEARDEAAELRKLWSGFWPSRVVITANNFRIFDHLTVAGTAEDVAVKLQLDLRGTEILLDALVSLGLLEKSSGRYRNSSLAGKHLVSGSPRYMGDIIRHADSLWRSWSRLDEVVKTGIAQREQGERDHESFIRGMHNLSVAKAPAVLDAVGLSGVATALDLGGGPGTYCIEMSGRGVRATLFDLPETIRVAREVIRASGAPEVAFIEGNFLEDDIGSGYDLILVSQIFHAFGEEECIRILEKCRDALNPGGRVAIQEFLLEEDRASPAGGALFAVNMLVATEQGRCYTPAEMKQWLKRTGFEPAAEQRIEESVLVIGKKGMAP